MIDHDCIGEPCIICNQDEFDKIKGYAVRIFETSWYPFALLLIVLTFMGVCIWLN